MVFLTDMREDVTDLTEVRHKLSTSFLCKIIRIGTYRVEDPKGYVSRNYIISIEYVIFILIVSLEQVTITSKGIRMLVPSCKDLSENVTLDIQLNDIVKIIFHFSPNLNILFLYNFTKCGSYIRETLDMKPKASGGAVESKWLFCNFKGKLSVRKWI